MSKKFTLIVSDPPYSFADQLSMSEVKRGAKANYPTLTIADIAQLPVKDLIDPNGAILALWVPSSMLLDGLRIMTSWGFDQKQVWNWIKIKKDPFKKLKVAKKIDWDKINWDDFLTFGMGRLGRNAHEVVLIGTHGKIYHQLKNKSQRTVFFAPNLKHSQKPEVLQDRLELMFDGPKIELFARRQRPGWECLGNEINGLDIREAIAQL